MKYLGTYFIENLLLVRNSDLTGHPVFVLATQQPAASFVFPGAAQPSG